MKKVLIIGHFWPYRGGSKRVIGLAKYLPKFEWEPIILTGPLEKKPLSEFNFVETDYRSFLGSWVKFLGLRETRDTGDQLKVKIKRSSPNIKSILRFFYSFIGMFLAYPDEDKNWKPFALKEAGKIFKREKIDAIISVWPMTSHIIANELKNSYRVPWIADFPDLWSQNYYYPYGPIRKFFDKILELKIIKNADMLTTISQPFVEKLRDLHKDKQIFPIMHGFDPEKINNPPINLTHKFTITYTGQIYTNKQNPSKFLLALKNLISEKIINPNDIEVRFYGPGRDWLEMVILDFGLSTVVKQYGIISHEDAIEKQRESHILLLLNWEDIRGRGVYTGKIFEYLAARRPIFATGGFSSDVIENLLKENKAGVYATNVSDIEKYLKDFYRDYKEKGKIEYNGDVEKINRCSHLEMARKFTDVLNQLKR